MTTCLNCDNAFEGAFCNLCGQKASTRRFTMHEWLHEIPHSILHVDSGFFLTIKTLFMRPGDAVREYLQGKRKLLFSPFLYVLVWCGVYVLVSHFLIHKPESEHLELKTLQDASNYIEENYFKIFVVVMIIPLTIASYLAYLRSSFNFAENLVLNAYLIGQLVIADIVMVLISTTSLDEDHKAIFKLIEFLIKYPFWFWMYWQFFKPSKWYWGILQFILAQLIAGIILSGLINLSAFILLQLKGSH